MNNKTKRIKNAALAELVQLIPVSLTCILIYLASTLYVTYFKSIYTGIELSISISIIIAYACMLISLGVYFGGIKAASNMFNRTIGYALSNLVIMAIYTILVLYTLA